MDASTQYRLEMADDAIAANADDPAQVAKLQAYKLRILDEVRPGQSVTEELNKPQFTGGNGGGRATQPRTERKASPGMMDFIARHLATKAIPDNNLHAGAIALYRVAVETGRPMAFRAAMDLGDWLKNLPVARTTTGHELPQRPASEAQLRMVNARRSAKGLRPLAEGELFADDVDEELAIVAAMPANSVSARVHAASELESGMYKVGDKIFKVYRAVHGSGKMCAKELVVIEFDDADPDVAFEYRGLAERFVTAADRMSLEDAKAFGAVYGVCCVCAATLTDEKSIEAGIGPVCGKRV